MAEYVRPIAQDLVDLATILASADWTAPEMHLSKADFNPTKQSVLTDYDTDEADFDGYAAASVTFSDPHVNAGGQVVVEALVSFADDGGTTPNTLYTAFLTNTAGDKLLLGSRLDGAPINIANIGDGVSLVITLGISAGVITVV